MSRQHKIWVDASGGSAKSFGCGRDNINMAIYVGSSSNYSEELARIQIRQHESGDEIQFTLSIDGQTYRTQTFNRKTKKFRGVNGRRITGNPKTQKKREKESGDSMMRSIGMVMAMGDILCDNQKEKNDWKERMLKAGLGGKGLIMPYDWGTLSEEEKAKRLTSVSDELLK